MNLAAEDFIPSPFRYMLSLEACVRPYLGREYFWKLIEAGA